MGSDDKAQLGAWILAHPISLISCLGGSPRWIPRAGLSSRAQHIPRLRHGTNPKCGTASWAAAWTPQEKHEAIKLAFGAGFVLCIHLENLWVLEGLGKCHLVGPGALLGSVQSPAGCTPFPWCLNPSYTQKILDNSTPGYFLMFPSWSCFIHRPAGWKIP